MMEYPKINTLYQRQFTETDPTTGELRYMDKGKSGNPLIIGKYSCGEFEAILPWTVTEKVDGTNVRIQYSAASLVSKSRIDFEGKTENSDMPPQLLRYLHNTISLNKMEEVFKDNNSVVLFGEGYGGKIQLPHGKKINPYRDDISFVLFDVYCDEWWVNRCDVAKIAKSLGIDHCPSIDNPYIGTYTPIWTKEEIIQYVQEKPKSSIALGTNHIIEGIVARSHPQMLFRDSKPIMFKLKCRDFN